MWADSNSCSLANGKIYDIEGIVLDYLFDPPQSTTNEAELRFHYLFSYNDEPNLLFLTQHDILQHINSLLPPTTHINDTTTSLTWHNLTTVQPDSLKIDTQQAMELVAPAMTPMGYKSILKLGSKIRIPRAVLGYTGGRPVSLRNLYRELRQIQCHFLYN